MLSLILILENEKDGRLLILYEHRGQEIKQLKEDIETIKSKYNQDTRKMGHDLALLKGEKER